MSTASLSGVCLPAEYENVVGRVRRSRKSGHLLKLLLHSLSVTLYGTGLVYVTLKQFQSQGGAGIELISIQMVTRCCPPAKKLINQV